MRLIYLSIWCYPKKGRKSLNPWAAFPLAATYSHPPSDLTRRRSIYFRCTLEAMRWTRKISAKVLGCADAITSHCVSALVFYDLIQRLRMSNFVVETDKGGAICVLLSSSKKPFSMRWRKRGG